MCLHRCLTVFYLYSSSRKSTRNCNKNVVIFIIPAINTLCIHWSFKQITKMRLSCPAVFFFTFIVIFAILIANVANLINNLNASQESYFSDKNHRWLEQKDDLRIDDSTEHLMWFVQVNLTHTLVLIVLFLKTRTSRCLFPTVSYKNIFNICPRDNILFVYSF